MEFARSDFVACAHAPWLRRWSEFLQPTATASPTSSVGNYYDFSVTGSNCGAALPGHFAG